MSVNKLCVALLVAGSFFIACGSDDESFATRPEGTALSSSEDVGGDVSSSSETAGNVSSSSGDNLSSSSGISSSSMFSSSSVASSSSVTSSSSEKGIPFCKTETEDNCEYGTLTDERDGQTYKTVKIGKRWWMAENLNYAYLQPTAGMDSSSFCYRDSAHYCEKYGRLYVWSAAMDSAAVFSEDAKGCGYEVDCKAGGARGVCPEGWHVPNTGDWWDLYELAGVRKPNESLKAREGWTCYEESDGDCNGTDGYGFSALPGGYRDTGHYYKSVGNTAFFWSSTQEYSMNNKNYYTRYALYFTFDIGAGSGVYIFDNSKHYAQSVRCVKEEE